MLEILPNTLVTGRLQTRQPQPARVILAETNTTNPNPTTMKVSALVITLNEEKNLSECLSSLAWCEQVTVLDSLSNDNTTSIARKHGAIVAERKFDNYANQRNYGINSLHHPTDWLLLVDADERVPTCLQTEIDALPEIDSSDGSQIDMYLMRRKDHLFGKWLKRSSGYPTWFGRLIRKGNVRVEREINEEYKPVGSSSRMKGHLHHYPFNKGIAWWLDRHNHYSTMESLATVEERLQKLDFAHDFSSDPTMSRRFWKRLVYRLPARPVIVFAGLYFFRLGFLDGRAGLTFCLLRAFYEFQIDCKIYELRLSKTNSAPDL